MQRRGGGRTGSGAVLLRTGLLLSLATLATLGLVVCGALAVGGPSRTAAPTAFGQWPADDGTRSSALPTGRPSLGSPGAGPGTRTPGAAVVVADVADVPAAASGTGAPQVAAADDVLRERRPAPRPSDADPAPPVAAVPADLGPSGDGEPARPALKATPLATDVPVPDAPVTAADQPSATPVDALPQTAPAPPAEAVPAPTSTPAPSPTPTPAAPAVEVPLLLEPSGPVDTPADELGSAAHGAHGED